MDLKFRSTNETSSNCYASSSNYSLSNPNNIPYFAHQAIRAGYETPELTRRENPNPNPNVTFDYRNSIQRELEKERIRAEIIAEEVHRRKLLEAEVRRELMLEREFAMRRGGGGGGSDRELSIGPTMWLHHRENYINDWGVGNGIPLLTNFEHRVLVSPHPEIGFSESRMLPFQRDPVLAGNGRRIGMSSGVKLDEIKESKGAVVEGINKDKVVILAKTTAMDLKRKASATFADPVDPSTVLKKPKTKDEWSCALCQITATCEQNLLDHLQGKKHKSRENGLNSERTGFGTGPLPKKDSHSVAKPIKVPGSSERATLKKDGNAGKSSMVSSIDQKSAGMEEIKTSLAKGKLEEASIPQKRPSTKPKKKFKFFCETCQIGVHSVKVMNAHKKGKRHLAKVMKRNKTDAISAQKSRVHEKVTEEPDVASSLEKGVVEEEKEVDNGVANNSSLEKGMDEENKEIDTIAAKESKIETEEDNVDEENKEIDTIAAKESTIETEEDNVETCKESDDCDVKVEADNDKVLEIDGEFPSVDKE